MKSERGSAILQVVILGSLLAILVPLMLGLVSASQTRQRERLMRTEFLSMINALREQLQDPHICPTLIGGTTLTPTPLAENPVSINTGYGPTPGPIGPGWQLRGAGGPAVGRLFVRMIAPNMSTVRLDKAGATYTKHWVRIYMEPQGQAWSLKDEPDLASPIPGATRPVYKDYAIDLHVKVQLNTIVQCHGTTSIGNACELAGGGYDGLETNPLRRCNPDTRCFVQNPGVVSSIAACNQPYVHTERISGPPGPDLFICMWCNDGVLNPP